MPDSGRPRLGIPQELASPLREALLQCDEFLDAQALQAVMAHELLTPWRDSLPSANAPRLRVNAVLSHLADQYRASGENALVVFLEVLADAYAESDRRHAQLAALAAQLRAAKTETGLASPAVPRAAVPGETDPKARLGAVLGTAERYAEGNRWAVLVGVDEYDDLAYPRLVVCVNDVEAIHERLLARGFEPGRVRLLNDETNPLPVRAEIYAALAEAARAAQRDDLLLFYYSGHGDTDSGASYLVGRDGRAAALKHTAVALADVAEIMRTSEARAKVIILDACHAGANFEGKGPRRMPPGFIERVFGQAKGQVVLGSCEQGQLSYEWAAQRRSVFTHFLLEALEGAADRDEKGFVTVQDVNRHVSDGVRQWAFEHHRSQTPTLQGAMAGDIVLARLPAEP